MKTSNPLEWIKPTVQLLNTNTTSDPGQSCSQQGKLGTRVDGITGNDGGTPGSTDCGS
jgi:hypothetical protein